MAKKIRLELDHDGFAALLVSPKVLEDITRRTNAIANAAGAGVESETTLQQSHGSERPVGRIWTASFEAKRAEATDKTLTSAIDAGRS